MAITNIHPIKHTLKKAIEYICDPLKTDGEILISSYECRVKIADIEFEIDSSKAIQKGNNLAHHLIQAFSPEDNVTAEKAHEIGKNFANEVLDGKYKYVLSTHIDKGHIHNHIIFNAVDFEKHRKYNSNKKSYYHIRQVSDRLCKENNLSVVATINSESKSKTYKEWMEDKNGTSYKTRLKNNIDKMILQSSNYDEFIEKMKALGYQIKIGKHIAFKFGEQERFTRVKALGEMYSEDRIKERIESKGKLTLDKNNNIKNRIDMNSSKISESTRYEHWAKIQNLKQASETLNYIMGNNIKDDVELASRIKEVSEKVSEAKDQIKNNTERIKVLEEIFKATETYTNKKSIYEKYKSKVFFKDEFYRQNESDIRIFESAKKTIINFGLKSFKDLDALKTECKDLKNKNKEIYESYYDLKDKHKELQTAKKNIDMLIGARKISDFNIEI